jgi:CHAT domain-containing protein/tetratricopeptide (TPR) repeat protein
VAQVEKLAGTAWTFFEQGDLEKSESTYMQAIQLCKEVKDERLEAICLSNLAHARQLAGKHVEAEQDLLRVIRIAVHHSMHRLSSRAHLALGEQKWGQGKADSARKHYSHALELSLRAEDAQVAEMAAGNLGRIYLDKGWAEQASEWFKQALELDEHGTGTAAWLGSLGLAMAELGQYDQAKSLYNKALMRAIQDGDVIIQATCKGSIGNLHFENNQLEEAIGCYNEALMLSREAGDEVRAGVWLGNIGNTWLRAGNVEKAVDCCRQAIEIARRQHDRRSLAAHLDSLGDCLVKAGEIDAAKQAYDEALSISTAIADKQGERIYLTNIGKVHQSLGQLQPAFEYFCKAIDLFDSQRSSIKSDDLKTGFANRGQDLFKDMIRVCMSLGKRVEALEYVGRAKSRALLDLLSNSPIDISEVVADNDPSLRALIEKERSLREQISHLERLFWQGPGEGSETKTRGSTVSQEETHEIYREWREVTHQLRLSHPNYASLISASSLTFGEMTALWDRPPGTTGGANAAHANVAVANAAHDADVNAAALADTADVVNNLDRAIPCALEQDTAIVELFLSDEYFLGACIQHGSSSPRMAFVENKDALRTLTNDISSFLEMSATEGWEVPRSICRRLYQALLEQVLDILSPSIQKLLIIPHNSLHHLPFAALHDGKQYLCQRFAISYLPTSSLVPIMARHRSEEKQRNYLISAISDYSATRENGLVFSSRLRSAAGLEDLSYTMEEAETIFQLGTKAAANVKLVRNDEVKGSLAALFQQFPIVHFAGHAIFNPDEPLASGLVLGDGSILTAASILQGNTLKTRCGRLLVLSACQTGVNMVTTGGEILGLARALMYAGMPNLVLSLWEVADRSTAQLMLGFHQSLIERAASGLEVSRALQEAQIRAIETGLPIHAWAPFIHMGIE